MAALNFLASALLFDMDGTIVDSTAIVERAWAGWASRHKLNLAEILEYSHGRPTLDTMRYFGARFLPGKDWQAEADEMREMEEFHLGGTVQVPGALQLISQLKENQWAVVTSAPRSLAEFRIAAVGLPLPKVLVAADEISKGKPDPEGYLKAARELRAEPAECIVFEDTPPGVEAGLNAGMRVIGLLTTVASERLRTKYLLRNLLEVRVKAAGEKIELTLPDPN